jgi:hypothetical protein
MSRFMAVMACVLAATSAAAQIGGDGRDGVFAPTSSVTLDTTHNGGVFHFRRIEIRPGITVGLTGPNPAILLSMSDVTIAGALSADGSMGPAGAGGYEGGRSYRNSCFPQDGKGPGGGRGGCILPSVFYQPHGGAGGHATPGKVDTTWYRFLGPGGAANGSAYPFTLWGGSGGGSAPGDDLYYGPYGGGGGGVIVLLADGAVTVSGTVTVRGGDAWTVKTANGETIGGPGAGGSILLRSMRALRVESGAVLSAMGGSILGLWYIPPMGGDGFVRLDAWGAPPVVLGKVEPQPLVLELPHLAETIPPRIGKQFGVSGASEPGDVVGLFLAKRGANLPMPPYGTLRLDPTADPVFIGALMLPRTGHDPIATVVFPVHNDAKLNGLGLHVQGLSVLSRRPRLTNALVTQILQ